MANFFFAWLRIPLSKWYEQFRGVKDSPNAQEAVKNVAHHAEDGDEFYQNMMTACWSEAFRVLKPGGLMAFTFHHSEASPMGDRARSPDGLRLLHRGDLPGHKRRVEGRERRIWFQEN